jgi:tetratricopeptide (TPR) repeat protein
VCLCSINFVLEADQAGEQWEKQMAIARHQLSQAAYTEAGETLRHALAVAETFPLSDVRRWLTRDMLGSAEEVMLGIDEAEFQYRTALKEIKAGIGDDNGDYAVVEEHLATVVGMRGRFREAETMLRDSLARQTRLFPSDGERLAHAHNFLAEILISERRYQDAEAELNVAVPLFERQPKQSMTAVALNNLAVVRHHQQRDGDAHELLLRSIDLLQREEVRNHPLLGRAYHNLASLDFIRGHREEAGDLYRQSLQDLLYLGRTHPTYLAALADYSVFLRRTGHKAEARVVEAQVKAARAGSPRLPVTGLSIDVSSFRSNY